MKIAIFCPNWIGDTVMATPALRAIRDHFRAAEIVAVMRPYVADVLEGLDLFDRNIFHQPQGGDVATERGWRFVKKLRTEKFDVAVLLPNSFRSALLAWASGAERRVGFARDGRRWLLNDSLSPKFSVAGLCCNQRVKSRSNNRRAIRDYVSTVGSKGMPHPVIDQYRRLAEHLGCRHVSRRMELQTTPADQQRFNHFLKRQNAVDGISGSVCLNPGGAFGSAKHWPTASFAELGRRIADKLHRRVIVLCGPAEREQAREIVRTAAHRAVTSIADEPPSIGLTKAAVRDADLLVTTDSGPRHFAAPFNVPVVTLFGPTHIEWSETFYERALHLQLDLDCGPCQQRNCPLGHQHCMTQLSVDQVFDAVQTMLQRFPRELTAA